MLPYMEKSSFFPTQPCFPAELYLRTPLGIAQVKHFSLPSISGAHSLLWQPTPMS